MLNQVFSKTHIHRVCIMKVGAVITLFSEQHKAKYCLKKQIENYFTTLLPGQVQANTNSLENDSKIIPMKRQHFLSFDSFQILLCLLCKGHIFLG